MIINYIRLIKTSVDEESFLYPFESHEFSTNATGPNGPTLEALRNFYAEEWIQNPDFFNMEKQGIQIWTVPGFFLLISDNPCQIIIYSKRRVQNHRLWSRI